MVAAIQGSKDALVLVFFLVAWLAVSRMQGIIDSMASFDLDVGTTDPLHMQDMVVAFVVSS